MKVTSGEQISWYSMSIRKADPTEKIDLSQLDEEERERCRTDLLHLARKYLHYNDMSDAVHGEVRDRVNEYVQKCKKWNAGKGVARTFIKGLVDKESKYPVPFVFLLHRGCLKTSLLAIAWVIQQILINPNITIRIVTFGWGRSVEINIEIKDHLQNPELIALFPDILWANPKKNAPKWGEDAFTVKRTAVVGGYTVKVDSIMGGITGSHCDIIVFDDLHDIENTQTAEQIRKVIQRFRNCRSVLKPGGLRIIIGTVWKRDDFYAWCGEQGFEIHRRTATYNSKGEECDCDDSDAHPFFPELFTIEELRQIKKELGRAFYACQYSLQALAEEDIKFTEEMIKYYETDPPYRKIWIFVDPALSRTRKADDSAICIVGKPKNPDEKLKVIKSRGLRVRPRQLIDAMLDEYVYFSQICSDMFLGVEQAQLQYILIEWLKEAMKERDLFFTPEELKHGNKPLEERVNRLVPIFENGGIELHRTRCEKLVDQLLDFGATTRNDHVAALAYLPNVLDENIEVQIIDPQGAGFNTANDDPNSLESIFAEMAAIDGPSWKDL